MHDGIGISDQDWMHTAPGICLLRTCDGVYIGHLLLALAWNVVMLVVGSLAFRISGWPGYMIWLKNIE